MNAASGSSNSTPPVPILFVLVPASPVDLILLKLEKGQLRCFPEDKRFLDDPPLESALEVLLWYESSLNIILNTHKEGGWLGDKKPLKCFGLTQGTACAYCDEILDDNQFGAKARRLGLTVAEDPVWAEPAYQEDGFDPLQIEAEIALRKIVFILTCDNGHIFESHSIHATGLPCDKCGYPLRLAGKS